LKPATPATVNIAPDTTATKPAFTPSPRTAFPRAATRAAAPTPAGSGRPAPGTRPTRGASPVTPAATDASPASETPPPPPAQPSTRAAAPAAPPPPRSEAYVVPGDATISITVP
jgi:translation initiation factor IF-2